jgi:phospholipase/carboxylesterase
MLDFLLKKPGEASDGDPVMILLHGRGSDMRDLQGLAQVIPDRGTLVTPQAPHPGGPWGYGPGWAWYRYLGEDRPEKQDLAESLELLGGFLQNLPDKLGFQPGPLVLGGFSQGGTVSLSYALSHPGSVDGVVVLSGFLPALEVLHVSLEVLGETPLFWAHGTHDPAVPFSLARRGWDRLRTAGLQFEAREYHMGHWVTPEEMEDLRRWLVRSVPGWVE